MAISSNCYQKKAYSLDDIEYYPETQIISGGKDDAYKVAFVKNEVQGIVGNFQGYPVQVINIQPNDVILLRISDDLDLWTCEQIQKEMNKTFPNNTTILCNDHIFKGLTILRNGKTEQIDETIDICSEIDVDELFEHVMKGHPNDFLY